MRIGFRTIVSGAVVLAFGAGAPGVGFAAEEATLTARAAATQRVEFDVFLPLEHRAELEKLLESLHDPKSPEFHKWLKPVEFNSRFGGSPERVSAIQSELTSRGLTVQVVAPRQLHVTGSAKSVERMFGSELKTGSFADGKTTTAFSRPYVLPSSIRAADGVVAGLSGKIRMRAHSVNVGAPTEQAATPANRFGAEGPYWFTDLKQAYSFPSYQAYDGTGSTLGVLINGAYSPADMTSYFGHEHLAAPNVIELKINGGGPYAGALETALDLQQSGGMAPKAQLVLFNIPSLSDRNILGGLVTVVESNAVDVLNMSFGGAEREYSPELNDGQDYSGILRAYDDLFAQGNAQGITFVASSGDAGALPLVPNACFADDAVDGCGAVQPSAEFPASSPHVTAVGGTNLVTAVSPSAPLNSSYVSENADDDPLASDIFHGTPATGSVWGSGGGESYLFRKPLYQTLVNTGTRFRAVPDVSLHMGGCPGGAIDPCPVERSADIAAYGGHLYLLIGTSASSPDFMGLLGLKIQRDQSRQGNVNYELYIDSAEQSLGILPGVFRKNIPGYNGYYSTKPGYDKVTGLGTVRGLNFLQAPAGTPVAGIPQTPSNP